MNKYFVGVGVTKAGTSWLGKYFLNHPEICFSPVKEIHYFDYQYLNFKIKEKRINYLKRKVNEIDDDISEGQLFTIKQHLFFVEMFSNPLAYHDYFSWLKNKNEKICGEITLEYAFLPKEGYQKINRLLNNPKIILIMRNPVDRIWSQVRFHKKFSPIIDFEKYYLESFNKKKFVYPSSYQTLLPNLYSNVKSNDIHIVFYEDLFNIETQKNVLKGLCDFLDVRFFQSKVNKRINSSVVASLDEKLRYFGVKKLKKSYEYVYENFENIPECWLKGINLL